MSGGREARCAPKWPATDSPEHPGTSRRASSCCTVGPQIMRTGVFEPTTIKISAGPWYRYAIRLVGRPWGASAQNPRIPQTNAHKSANYRANTDSGRVGPSIASFYHDQTSEPLRGNQNARFVSPIAIFCRFFCFSPFISKCALSAAPTRIVFLRSASKCALAFRLENPNAHFGPLREKYFFFS